MVKGNNILVTGSEGQLGNSLKSISDNYPNYNFIFKNKKQLDISNFTSVKKYVQYQKINTIINCAAFTNVEDAENNKEKANLINNISVNNLAKVCDKTNTQLIHISTDFVFDGVKGKPYNEDDKTNPLNYYGSTKLKGELKMLNYSLKNSVIIRTSWLYSENNNNFVSKIHKQILENKIINVVENEIGSPTNAENLAKALIYLLPKIKNSKPEIYHFSDKGSCSRYQLAKEINFLVKGNSNIIPVNKYSTNCVRPNYSALNTNKIKHNFDLKILNWKISLRNHLSKKLKIN